MALRNPVALTPGFVLALGALLSAQCNKPSLPANGLPTSTVVNTQVTYSDGYKTFANLTYPSGQAPSCGWPLVVFVHGYGGKRSVQRGLASHGFAVVAYDVRGQGDAKNANPKTKGMTFYGATEKYDLAEMIAFARSKWKNLVSQTKVGVTGGSQGGIHSWFAAAYSGKKITISGRGTITFPKVDAVVPQNFVPDVMHHSVRGGTLFAVDALNRAFGGNKAAVLDAALVADFRNFFLKQDPQGLVKKLENEAGRPVASALSGTTVPIMYHHAWLDGIQSPREAVRVIGQMAAKAPVRTMLSTIGHGSPNNTYEALFREQLRRRWFDRFLWGIQNEVEKEAASVNGVQPVTNALTSALSLWDHRHDPSSTAPDLASLKLYLTSSGQLNSTASSGAAAVIKHTIATGYTPQKFASAPAQWQTSTILANVPLSQRIYTMAALGAERELGGSPRVSLQVVPNASRFHLCVLLMAKIPGVDREHMLARWGRGVLGARPNSAMRVTFDLSPAYARLPKGTVLRLIVRNHWLREYPMQRRIVTAPYFVPSQVQIVHATGASASFLDLPFRKEPRVGLVTAMVDNRLASLSNALLGVRGGAARANKPVHHRRWSVGACPGHTAARWHVAHAMGRRFRLVAGHDLRQIDVATGFLGTLNTSGNALATCRFADLSSAPKELVGQRLTFTAWVHTSSTNLFGRASNPIDIIFR